MPKLDVMVFGKPKGGHDGEDEEEGPKSSPRELDSTEEDAMADMIEAFKSDDPKAAALAFKRAYEACHAKHEEEDEDGDEEGY